MTSVAMTQAGLFVEDGVPLILVALQKLFIPLVAFLARSFIVAFRTT
jgi:hypothetical protein